MQLVRGDSLLFFVSRWHLDDDHLSYLGEDLYHFSHMYTPMGIHCTPRVLEGCDSRYGDGCVDVTYPRVVIYGHSRLDEIRCLVYALPPHLPLSPLTSLHRYCTAA